MNMNNIIKPTIRSQVYDILKQRIMEDYYKAGSKLSEQQICDELQVSRSPVREAFRQLEADGLLISNANKGVIVKKFTEHDVESFYEIESSIQAYSINTNRDIFCEEEKEKFKALKIGFEEAYKKKDLNEYLKLSEQFHYEIICLSSNSFLVDIYKRIGILNYRFRLLSLKDPTRFDKAHKEHKQIIEAILKDDAALAKQLLKNHIEEASKVVIRTLTKE